MRYPNSTPWLSTPHVRLNSVMQVSFSFSLRTQDVVQTLKISAPNGVDVFLDSVGGAFHNTVLAHMAQNGRVCIFGNLSVYNNPRDIPLVPSHDLAVALKVKRPVCCFKHDAMEKSSTRSDNAHFVALFCGSQR